VVLHAADPLQSLTTQSGITTMRTKLTLAFTLALAFALASAIGCSGDDASSSGTDGAATESGGESTYGGSDSGGLPSCAPEGTLQECNPNLNNQCPEGTACECIILDDPLVQGGPESSCACELRMLCPLCDGTLDNKTQTGCNVGKGECGEHYDCLQYGPNPQYGYCVHDGTCPDDDETDTTSGDPSGTGGGGMTSGDSSGTSGNEEPELGELCGKLCSCTGDDGQGPTYCEQKCHGQKEKCLDLWHTYLICLDNVGQNLCGPTVCIEEFGAYTDCAQA